MKKLIIALSIACLPTIALAQTTLQSYQPGPRLIDGSQLNLMVAAVNALQGTTGTSLPSVVSKATLNHAPPTADTGTVLQVVGANSTIARVELDAFAQVPVFSSRRTDGTIAAPTAVLSTDELGSHNVRAYDGTVYGPAARFSAFATENWSATAHGSKIVFSTVPNTTLTLTDQVTIDNDGGVAAKALTLSGQLRTTFGTPTIASGACGTTTNGVITSGTNQAGLITIGAASTTTCTVSFSATLAAAPGACVVFPHDAGGAATGTTVARVSSVTTGGFVITGSALATTSYYYICI